MESYYGYQSDVMVLPLCTMEEFEKKYRDLAYGKDTLVKASTILPVIKENDSFRNKNGEILYDCIIFYDIKRKDPREEVESHEDIMLDM